MIIVKYEEYWNDFRRSNHVKTFSSLEAIEEWVFSQMQQDYRNNTLAMWFPRTDNPNFGRIEFQPSCTGPDFWIHQIESDEGIIFSDGKFTCGKKHASQLVKDWLLHCRERRDAPVFKFAD